VTEYVIVGHGVAGVSAAEVIRRRDPIGRITIIGDEPFPLYSRPGIAYYALNQIPEQQLFSRRESFYRDNKLERLVDTALEVDLEARQVYLEKGRPLAFDALLVATGARAVMPEFPGNDLDGVLTFDRLEDARQVIRRGRKARAAVVVGGGITALEMAEALGAQHAHTHLLQRGDRIWPRLFDEREAAIVARAVAHEGITVHYRQEIASAIGHNGRLTAIRTKAGDEIACQILGVAVGVKPNLALVRRLTINLDQGVLVNDYMQSSHLSLFAAGDVAQVLDRWTGRHYLDILWPSAIAEGRVAGFNMVDFAHGRAPTYAYTKTSPFNAALLFGLHLTVIGQIGESKGGRGGDEQAEELSYLSRGSSQVWTAPFGVSYRSAWDHRGESSLRITMAGGRITGALLLGNQELADPLRQLIEGQVALNGEEADLHNAGEALPRLIKAIWQRRD
jgi:NADPH-dependent 2,4-dienoyl-CoA reductase/sulfur reductase-like enzyme